MKYLIPLYYYSVRIKYLKNIIANNVKKIYSLHIGRILFRKTTISDVDPKPQEKKNDNVQPLNSYLDVIAEKLYIITHSNRE